MPGAAAVVGAAFAGLAVQAATRPIDDPDVWWVAAAGRYVLATGEAPVENMYSYLEPGRPWVMHEWLFGAPYALGLERLGPSFFALAALGWLTIAAALVAQATLGACRRPVVGAALALLGLGVFGSRLLSARPASAAMVFPAAMVLLAFAPRMTRGRALAAVVVELLWANAHGSFPLGVVLLGAGALEHAGGGGHGGAARDGKLRVAAAIAAAAVTLVNPYGVALHRLVLGYLAGDSGGTYSFIREHLTEFAPLWRDGGRVVGAVEVAGLALVAALAASAAWVPRWRVRALLCAGLVGMAVSHVRHVELCGLVAVMLLAPHADALAGKLGVAARQGAPSRGLALAALGPGVVAALVAHGAAHRERVARGERGVAGWIAPGLGGEAMVGLAEALPDGARVFAPFKASGLLIWLTAERGVRVTRDPRNDCYGREVLEAALALDTPAEDAATAHTRLLRAGADHLLLGPGAPLRRWVEGDAAWRTVKEAHGYVLLSAR
ncbi:hypothetical protein [Chondromyces apiculatus]|nr:hypothetical protein [Chondromyces apiculatus]